MSAALETFPAIVIVPPTDMEPALSDAEPPISNLPPVFTVMFAPLMVIGPEVVSLPPLFTVMFGVDPAVAMS